MNCTYHYLTNSVSMFEMLREGQLWDVKEGHTTYWIHNQSQIQAQKDRHLEAVAKVILPHGANSGIIKKTTRKLQVRTTDGTNINIAQQLRWHTLVNSLFDEMWMHNFGSCNQSNTTFGEVIEHLVIGIDDMCLLSPFRCTWRLEVHQRNKQEETWGNGHR